MGSYAPYPGEMAQKKQTSGVGLAIGLAVGVAIGVAIGAASGNMLLWIALATALGLVFGISYDELQKKKRQPAVKVAGGATYTLIARDRPVEGQNCDRWVGDNGVEIELTDLESAERGLDQI